jgi:hypothetical protein
MVLFVSPAFNAGEGHAVMPLEPLMPPGPAPPPPVEDTPPVPGMPPLPMPPAPPVAPPDEEEPPVVIAPPVEVLPPEPIAPLDPLLPVLPPEPGCAPFATPPAPPLVLGALPVPAPLDSPQPETTKKTAHSKEHVVNDLDRSMVMDEPERSRKLVTRTFWSRLRCDTYVRLARPRRAR